MRRKLQTAASRVAGVRRKQPRTSTQPPAETLSKPVAYLNYGETAPTQHGSDYKTIIGLSFRTSSPAIALRYVSPMAANGVNYGVTYATASANGWVCNATDGSGHLEMPGNFRYVPRLDLTAYRNAWVSGVTTLIGTLDGCFCDDVQGYIQAVTGGKTPTEFPTEASWYAAIVDFITYMSNYFRAQGKYFAVNATNNNQTTDPGNTNNGNRNKQLYADLASPSGRLGVNGIMSEFWVNHPAIPVNNGNRPSGTSAWYAFWENWRSITPQLNAVGVDFYPLHEARGKIYGLCSFLLDWNGTKGAYIFSNNYVSDSNPWDADFDKALALGAPLSAASLSGGVWTRQFQNGFVTVNPTATTASITIA